MVADLAAMARRAVRRARRAAGSAPRLHADGQCAGDVRADEVAAVGADTRACRLASRVRSWASYLVYRFDCNWPNCVNLTSDVPRPTADLSDLRERSSISRLKQT